MGVGSGESGEVRSSEFLLVKAGGGGPLGFFFLFPFRFNIVVLNSSSFLISWVFLPVLLSIRPPSIRRSVVLFSDRL